MTIDPATALEADIRGEAQYFCSIACRDKALRHAARPRSAALLPGAAIRPRRTRTVDPVCKMEVNPNWRISTRYRDQTFFFCTRRCLDEFKRDPGHFLAPRCLVCGRPLTAGGALEATYLDHTYDFCSEQHRAQFKADPAAYFMHSMWGIPGWLYYASIAIVLVLSFGVFELLARMRDRNSQAQRRAAAARTDPTGACATGCSHTRPDRFNLLAIRPIRAALSSRAFRFAIQFVFVVFFFLIIVAGLVGNQNPALNIAPLLTWTIWWGLLIVLIMYAGKSWCYVCPWDAVAGWTEQLAFWKKRDVGLSLNLKWPRVFRNILIATVFFVGLTWVELGFGVTMKPRTTAYLALGMLFMAVGSALVFEKKSFCRYACLVGRVSGLYAMFASTEVRSKSEAVCKSCGTKECVKGSETAHGCPTFLYPGKLASNTYCIQCMECVQACPHDNLAVNLRPWGSDLAAQVKPRSDEALLALLMLAITGFHGLTMTPVWRQLIDAIRAATSAGRVLAFSLGMVLLMLAPIACYALLVAASKRLGDQQLAKPVGYRDYFIQYAYALLPIALFYHIAHNCEHLLMEGPKIAAMISDPFGWGWNVFGTAGWTIPPMISLQQLWVVQVVLVLVGHIYSLWIAQKTSVRLFGATRAAFRSQLPMLLGMIAFSVFSLWLLKQPMEMRTTAM